MFHVMKLLLTAAFNLAFQQQEYLDVIELAAYNLIVAASPRAGGVAEIAVGIL
jgi:hypothetical protein